MFSRPAAHVAAAATAVVVLAAGITAVTLLPGAGRPAAAALLQPYESCIPLLAHYRAELHRSATSWGIGRHGFYGIAEDGLAFSGAAPMPTMMTRDTAKAVGSGPTGTNTQEAGVDEPDTAKIAGGLIFTVMRGRLHVLRAGARPELLSRTEVSDEERSYGAELLVDGDRVLVLSSGWRNEERSPRPLRNSRLSSSKVFGGRPVTTLVLFDVGDPRRPRRLEEYTIDAQYLSARFVAGRVRLVTSAVAGVAGVQPEAPHGRREEQRALAENRRLARLATIDDVLPRVERRNGSGRLLAEGRALKCKDVRRADDPRGASTLVVTTFVPQRKGLEPTDTTGVTTDGDLVYASTDRLYVATSRWGTTGAVDEPRSGAGTAAPSSPTDAVSTEIHAFTTGDEDDTEYLGSGSVPGYVLGRWAFSAHGGHLRVATTRQPPWGDRGQQAATSSSVVVLAERDGRLVETGRLDGLGKGERIFAVRYFGDLATVVTFRQIDPLYVLDLSDPAAPRVRGELKIPGFSTYLHPVGDDLLLGLGHDADRRGVVTGMQLSLFDLSDLSAPRRVSRLALGRGWSAALHESRAFGYDPVRRLALLPFASETASTGVALGVTVPQRGALREAGRLAAGPGGSVERVLYDENHVYAIGHTGIVAADAATLRETGTVFIG